MKLIIGWISGPKEKEEPVQNEGSAAISLTRLRNDSVINSSCQHQITVEFCRSCVNLQCKGGKEIFAPKMGQSDVQQLEAIDRSGYIPTHHPKPRQLQSCVISQILAFV